MKALLWLGLICASLSYAVNGTAANNPVKMAETARFDLMARPEVGSLTGIETTSPVGKADLMDWLPLQDRNRGCSATFPIVQYAWTEFVLRFVPSSNGIVEMRLMGPWAEASAGVLFRQDVLWDDIRATGTTVTNNSFEQMVGNRPQGWEFGGGVANSGPMPAFEGRNYARTWHNSTLTALLPVVAGREVTLRIMGRSIPPPQFKDMRRIVDRKTPAHEAAKLFLRGANLGNGLETPPGESWGIKYSVEDLANIRKEGFDHVRIPIGWHHYAGPAPSYTLSPEIFSKVDILVTNALQLQLNVMINIHHFNEFYKDPTGRTPEFYAIWRQIAAHYENSPNSLAFELINEPMDKATTPLLNPIYAEVIRQIRQTNPQRTIFVGPGDWNSIDELGKLDLPYEEDNVIVAVHCYEPMYFTHQGASWSGPDFQHLKGIVFPGPPSKPFVMEDSIKLNTWVQQWIKDYNTKPAALSPSSTRAFRPKLERAKQWSDYYGRPVHLGEFGAYQNADNASRTRFYSEFRKTLESLGIGWAMWDWRAGFNYWDATKNAPVPGMPEALFGER